MGSQRQLKLVFSPRLLPLLALALLVALLGFALSLPAAAGPAAQATPREAGQGSGIGGVAVKLPPDELAQPLAPLVPSAPEQSALVLSETFEGVWPGNWQVYDGNGGANGEYYWNKRSCRAHTGSYSGLAVGGGQQGAALPCGALYPHNADAWMISGPLDLSGATSAELTFAFWLDSECEGTNCATKSDRLWAYVYTDPNNPIWIWRAGDWFQRPGADPNGWVSMVMDVSALAGQSAVRVAFNFESDGTANYPGGAFVDDIVLHKTTGCTPTATIRSLTLDRSCYTPGATIGAFVDVGTGLASQNVRVKAELWMEPDLLWASNEVTFTAPGSRVIPVVIPTNIFAGDYVLRVSVYDAITDCLQDQQSRPLVIDPMGGSVTPPVSPTPTSTPTFTRTPTRTPSLTPSPTGSFGPTLCPGQSAHETKNIFIPAVPARADIVFAFDASGSMSNEIGAAQSNAIQIMNSLAALIPDIYFGVLDFLDYPTDPYGRSTDHVYLLRQAVTDNRTAVQSAINAIATGHGGDEPEAYTRALYETYADPAVGWRRDTRRFVIVFGDSVAHDDDLNVGIASPPYHAGTTWRTGYAPAYRDPGRDGTSGTADDLDFQTVLDGLRANNITLLFVVPNHYAPVFPDLPSASVDTLYTYWKQWAARTGAGGDAVKLANTTELPVAIQNLVTAASRRISRLELLADPPSYQAWLTVNPPAYTNLDIPPGGLTVTFEVDVRAPPGTAVGRDYTFAVRAVGDGGVYGGQGVTIHVPASCITAPPTPTRTPTRTLTPTPTMTPTCVPPRPPVTMECPPSRAPNYIRNPHFEYGNRSWGEFSQLGRELVDTANHRASFYGPPGLANHELLYQMVNIPPDAEAISFWVSDYGVYAAGWGTGDPPPPPANGLNYLRASLYDATLSVEVARLWQLDLAANPACQPDPPGYNLTPTELALVRGRTVSVVLEFKKVTTAYNWQAGASVDDIHLHVCSPGPPCRVDRDKTASPSAVAPGGEVTVMLSLTGLDGSCLPARQPADVALVLDRSGSMLGQKIADAKTAAKAFVDRMDLSMDQVALISFSSSPRLDQGLIQTAGPVRSVIDGLIADGNTDIAGGITTAQAELTSSRHRPGNQPVMILLSDGQPTTGDPRAAAAAARSAGTRIFTVGLGGDADQALMRDLASAPSDFFYAPTSSQLDTIYQQIAGVISGSPATNIVFEDRLSPYVTLIPNSFTGLPTPSVSSDGRTLTWRIPRLGLETLRWSYRVKMTNTPGAWPTNDYATATYTDSRGHPASLTFPIPQVTVLPPAARHPQIMCMDHATDNGSVPSNSGGEAWWSSPDIWVRHQRDDIPVHQNPVAGQTNYLYVRVRNSGDTTVNDIRVHVYDTPGAASIRWPDEWVPEVGVGTITNLAAGQIGLAVVPWTPGVAGHTCFLARIEAADDPITVDGWVPFDNNICQKNVQVIEGASSSSGVRVRNAGGASGYGSVQVKARSAPLASTIQVSFTDPTLFQRWQGAGGSVQGGEVIPGANAIRLPVRPSVPLASGAPDASDQTAVGVIDAVIERIPLAGEEQSQLTFSVDVPAGSDLPTLEVTQVVDGQVVGGAILQPKARGGQLFLPLIAQQSIPPAPRSTATPTPTPIPPDWQTLVNEGFEGIWPSAGWRAFDADGGTNGEYLWARRACRAAAGSYSAWAVGGGANGSLLDCGADYADNTSSWIIYGPFSLAGATAAELRFKLWLNSESDYDNVFWGASINGTNFYGVKMSGATANWTDRLLDLTNVYSLGNLTSQPQVWIAFNFQTDDSVTESEGAFVDDVVVRVRR